jgi:hypothetical protein
MKDKFKAIIKKLFAPKMSAEELYLSKSVDHFDLENRQRELQRRQFDGGNFKTLYNKFYI